MATQPSNIPVLPPPQDFTAADFDSCRQALQADVSAAFPAWTDFNRAAAGNVLLLAFCYVLDILRFYQNNQAREAFFATVQRRRNMIALARGLGIKLKGIGAASADVEFTLSATSAFDVVIPQGTQVSAPGNPTVQFFTSAVLTISAGNLSGTVSAINSISRVENFQSDGTASQSFTGTFLGFVQDTDFVRIDNELWVRVDNFFNSGALDKHYTVLTDESDRITFVFGNGVNGLIPNIGQIEVAYQTGGGGNGNVDANTITLLTGSFQDLSGASVVLTPDNPVAAGGGADRETVEQARRRIPGKLRALTRTDALEDYEINALTVVGVARAVAITSNQDSGVAENTVELVILPVGDPPTLPSSALKDAVKAQVTIVFPNTLTVAVIMVDPVFNTIPVSCDVKVKNGFTLSQVTTNIETALASFFALQTADGSPNPNVEFGVNLTDQLVTFTSLFTVVAGAAGVDRVDEDTFSPADDVVLAFREFPKLGAVSVSAIP